MGGMTLLILVALAFSTPGGGAEFLKAALPGGPVERVAWPETDRAPAQVAVRQVSRRLRDQDFRGQLALALVRTGARVDRAPAVRFVTPGMAPELLRADLLSLPPPALGATVA